MTNTAAEKESFEHWLTNTFWFHYKWYWLFAVFALTFLVLTVVRMARNVDYDVELCYISEKAADEAEIGKIMADIRESGDRNGDRIKVGIENIPLKSTRGERLFFENLKNPDEYFYLLDEASLKLCNALGYFGNAEWIPGLSLYAAVRDVPIRPYTKEDFPDVDYEQEQIDRSNEYRQEQHKAQLANAQAIIDGLK